MKYDRLDAAILDRIQQGHTQFFDIWFPLSSLANPHVKNRYSGADRVVDRRLQAIRKRGRIAFKNGRWGLVAGT